MLNLLGKNSQIIGSGNDELIFNSGKIRIKWGNKFINLLDSKGNINTQQDLVQKVSSRDDITTAGIYLVTEENCFIIYYSKENSIEIPLTTDSINITSLYPADYYGVRNMIKSIVASEGSSGDSSEDSSGEYANIYLTLASNYFYQGWQDTNGKYTDIVTFYYSFDNTTITQILAKVLEYHEVDNYIKVEFMNISNQNTQVLYSLKNIPIYLHGSIKNIVTSEEKLVASEEKLAAYEYNTFDKGVIIGELPPTLCYKSAYSSYDKNDEEKPDPYINNCGLYSRQSIFESALFDCSKHNQVASSGGNIDISNLTPQDCPAYSNKLGRALQKIVFPNSEEQSRVNQFRYVLVDLQMLQELATIINNTLNSTELSNWINKFS